MRLMGTLMIVLYLVGCTEAPEGDEADSRTTAEATPEVDETARPRVARDRAAERDSDAMRELMRDPEARAALRERMAALPEPRRGNEGTEAASEGDVASTRRGRNERAADGIREWWARESLGGALSLTTAQIERLDGAHAELTTTMRRSRRELARISRAWRESLAPPDRDRLETLLAERRAALADRRAAESAWVEAVLEILSDEQLRVLAENHPRLVDRVLSPR